MVQFWKRHTAILLAVLLLVSVFSVTDVQAAKKKTVKLSASTVKLKVGKTKTIKVKNTTKSKIKKVKWKITRGKSYIKIFKKTKKYVKIKAKKKAGTAVVQAKISTKAKKTYTRKVKIKVQKNTSTSSETSSASATSTPAATNVSQNKNTTELLHYTMKTSSDGKTLLDQSGNGNDATLVNVDATVKENHSLLLQKNGYIELPKDVFAGKDTLTISIWAKDYSGKANTSAMFVGTTENYPVSYWLLNPCNPAGRMKSVMTNGTSATAPWSTEVGISASEDGKGVDGPLTGTEWNHFVTVITKDSITGYCNGKKVGTSALQKKFSDFGSDIVAYIGKSSYPDATFTGFIREVQVFSTAKTDAEVAKIYQDTKGADMGAKSEKSEIFIADRADPFITKAKDGYYYFTASYPMYGESDKDGYDRIILRRSKTLSGLKDAEEKVIWDEKDSSISHRFIWAPEMHYIGGKWYMYYAASGSSNNVWDINCHALMCEGQDPYNDNWVEKGKFQAASGDTLSFKGFSLDMTYFECNGKSYVIWAQKPSTSNLYMAEVNPEEPWKTTTKAMLLTRPEYYWECVNIPVNEGPSVIIHDGKVIVAYSASATGPEYCIGYMYADVNSDLMNKSSWTKQETPALESGDLVDEYGPGHNSFTEDENGNPIFVYHSRPKECFEGKCDYSDGDPLYDPCRSAHLRKVTWDENGLPILNAEPYPID